MNRDIKLIVVLAVSLLIAIFIIKWANEPEYRPLIQDLRLVDAVKIADALEQSDVQYYADVQNHMLYVVQEQSVQARIALAKVGIVIDYPEITKYNNLNQAYEELSTTLKQKEINKPIWMQFWFFKVIKLALGALVIIVLILSVVRPALRELVLEEDEK
ncbi:hypothetical protein tinsulaeT_00160 [Thalassotalea insulae]|uniref:Flagellar M-ring N-terminal domain-containing protein n=1 Tax=Thalassotalea insulae TaxID=2056778 RepID=A0ABQ6GLG0_9GAMM|nr:hypothetical protein [Thalassotalea insulae]GLX76676.1 hypothetical protein tinsulaeT_00160 [Thalassotalea insulae]